LLSFLNVIIDKFEERSLDRACYASCVSYSSALALRLGERVAARCGVNSETDLVELTERLGGSVHFAPGPAVLEILDEDRFRISLPDDASADRRRFDLAHKLGHLFLHVRLANQSETKRYDESASVQVDSEADWFAFGMLMPTPALSEFASDDPALVAEFFGVPPRAAKFRLQFDIDTLNLDA
jgi:hypothetical protein